MDDFLHEEQLPSVEDYIEKEEEVVEQIEETVEPEEVESTVDLTEILRLISDVRKDIPEIPEIKEYDAELAAICEVIDDLKEQIPTVPEVKYYDDELEAVCEQIDWVKEYIQTLPEVKYYDDQISSIEDRINNLPEVKYYEKDIESIKEDFEKLREDIKLIPDFSWIAKTFKDVDSDVNVLNDAVDTLSEKTRLEFERFSEDLEVRTFDNKVSIDNLKEDNKQFSEKVSEEKDKIWKELSAFSLKIWEHHKQFKDDDRKLRKQILGEYNVLKKSIEEKLEEVNQSSVKTDELLLNYFKELKEQVDSLPEVKYYDQQLSEVSDEVKGLYSIVEEIKKKQSVLKEERIVEQIVKVESPDKNFATLDDLQEHYRKFVSSIQQQLSTVGGGGETRLEFLDDLDRDTALVDGKFLKYQASTKTFVGADASGGSVGVATAASSLVLDVRNNNIGYAFTAGTPVYQSGFNSGQDRICIEEARASEYSTMPAKGAVTTDLANNTNGQIIVYGELEGVDTSAFDVAYELYVAPGGGLTNTRPTGATDLVQKIAVVLKKSAANGAILVYEAGRTNDVPNSISIAGSITAASAQFSGNLIVGGTITYGDVTNVDSLGLGTLEVVLR